MAGGEEGGVFKLLKKTKLEVYVVSCEFDQKLVELLHGVMHPRHSRERHEQRPMCAARVDLWHAQMCRPTMRHQWWTCDPWQPDMSVSDNSSAAPPTANNTTAANARDKMSSLSPPLPPYLTPLPPPLPRPA